MSARLRIKIITPDERHARDWAEALSRPGQDVVTHAEPLRQVNVLVNGSRPDLVVAETTEAQDLAALEQLAAAHPEIDYVLVSHELSPEALMRMMRAGVREVLPAPAGGDALREAVERLARKRAHQPAPATVHQGQVLAFLSCKGGSGATFVAANLAHMLAAGGERRVALIDLNLQFGDAALFVTNDDKSSDVAEVARNIGRLDRDLLQSAMIPAAPGLWVLAAPADPAHAAEVLPEHVQAILKIGREMFDFVVLDIGRSLSSVSLQAMDAADHVYAVLQLTVPYLRDARRLREVFHSLDYPARKIHWVVNRHQKDSQITLDDLKKTLGVTDAVVLPNQYREVAASVNQGSPLAASAPGAAITRALRDFAAQIAPPTDKPRAGWLSGLLRGAGRSRGSDAT